MVLEGTAPNIDGADVPNIPLPVPRELVPPRVVPDMTDDDGCPPKMFMEGLMGAASEEEPTPNDDVDDENGLVVDGTLEFVEGPTVPNGTMAPVDGVNGDPKTLLEEGGAVENGLDDDDPKTLPPLAPAPPLVLEPNPPKVAVVGGFAADIGPVPPKIDPVPPNGFADPKGLAVLVDVGLLLDDDDPNIRGEQMQEKRESRQFLSNPTRNQN